MSRMVTNLTPLKWRCSRCKTWNDIEQGVCSQCKALNVEAADAFRVEDVLTNQEKNFYHHTAPAILRELREVKTLLGEINDKL